MPNVQWVVLGPNLFAVKPSEQEALECVKRLANTNVGREYHVLKTNTIVKVPVGKLTVTKVNED